MNKIRTLVVDDEPMARERVLSLLQQEDDVEVVGECSDGTQALAAIQHQSPDLVFLDVQMPGLDGFGVIEAVGAEKMPTVIFVTAYDEYALKAFEVHAIDYLLKPFSRERLSEAIARARARVTSRNPSAARTAPDAAAVAVAARPPGAWITRVVIRDGAEVHVVPIDRIDFVEAQDDYIAVHAGDRTLLKDQPLSRLEAQLGPRRFVRVHRSYLLNLDRLAKLEAATRDTKAAVLRDGRRLPVSRSGLERLQQLL